MPTPIVSGSEETAAKPSEAIAEKKSDPMVAGLVVYLILHGCAIVAFVTGFIVLHNKLDGIDRHHEPERYARVKRSMNWCRGLAWVFVAPFVVLTVFTVGRTHALFASPTSPTTWPMALPTVSSASTASTADTLPSRFSARQQSLYCMCNSQEVCQQ